MRKKTRIFINIEYKKLKIKNRRIRITAFFRFLIIFYVI